MCIEGPTITTAGAFGVALGYFNPFLIFFLSILGDVFPDSLYYWVGRFGRLSLAKKINKKFGISEKRIKNLEKHIEMHGGKAVAILKYTPVLATPGLMLVGAMKMNWWRFIETVLIVTTQRTIVLMLLGYFFGRTYDAGKYINIGKYLRYGALAPLILLVIFIVFMHFYRKYFQRKIVKLEKF